MTRIVVAAAVLALAVTLWPRPTAGWPRTGVAGRPLDVAGVGGSLRSAPDVVAGQAWWRLARSGGFRPGRPPRSRAARREAERRTDQVLDLLDALAPALRAGLAPAAALRAVAPPSPDRQPGLLGDLLDAADRAEDLAPVWRAEAVELASTDLGLIAAAWALCERLGSSLAPTVGTVSRVVRQRRAVRQRMEAAVAGPRTSMTVLTALPVVGPILALAVGVSPVDLYASPAGVASLVAGVVLLGVGRLWGARLIASIGVDGRAERSRP